MLGYINRSKCLLLILFASINWLQAQQVYPVKQNGKYGFIDNQKNWIVKPKYDWISDEGKSSAYLVMVKDSIFILDKKLQLFQEHDVKKIKNIGTDYYGLQHISGLWAITNKDLKEITAYSYSEVDAIDTFFKVSIKHKVGLLNPNGTIKLPIVYEDINFQGNGVFTLRKGSRSQVLLNKDTGFFELNT